MASVQFDGGKCHGAGEAKALMRHACADERVRHEHSNEDIDISKTAQNSDLHGLTYQQMCEIYDRQIDGYRKAAAKSLRRDAVTLYDATITVPKDLPADKQDDWFRDVENIINQHYGKRVVLDIKIHRDEIHDYVDPATKRTVTSRVHGHAFMFPDVDGRLNAKKFSSRANMRTLNREIDAMTRDKYHCIFLTGEKAKDRGFQSVEQLKQASDTAELQRQVREAQYQLDAVHREIGRAETQRDKVQAEVDELSMERTFYSAAQVSDSEKRAKTAVFDRDTVKLPREDYEAILRTAKAGEQALKEAKRMARERRQAEKAVQAKQDAAERKAAEMISGADKQATAILERAKQDAQEARQKAAQWQEQADSLQSAHEEYEALRRDSERFQSLMQQEYTRSVFKAISVTEAYEAARRGKCYAKYPDGTFEKLPVWDGVSGLSALTHGRNCVYGIITNEPMQAVPNRVLREVRQLARGQHISKDLQAVLDHAEGLDIAKHHSRGIER